MTNIQWRASAAAISSAILGVLLLAPHCQLEAGQNHETLVGLCSQDEDIGIRLYYNPMMDGIGTAHSPMILFPASSQDPRLGTRSDWILYVTLADLRKVLHLLSQTDLSWEESASQKQIVVEAMDLPEPHHNSMQILVNCTCGSAVAELQARQVCSFLHQASRELTGPKALNSMIFYEKSVCCDSEQRPGRKIQSSK